MSPVIEEIREPSEPRQPLEPGLVLAGRFCLREKLGEGAMGAVWSAEELATGRQVALKVLKIPARDARIRFLREAWAASRARHANVVDVLDLVEAADGTLVIVMELLCGETLGALLRREGKLGVAETCAVLLSVVEAIAAVHRAKMVHRDVKPDNIFIEHKPDGRRVVKLLDFGVAKVMGDEPAAHVEDAQLTTAEGILGTPYYMAPEQVFADEEIDERIDVWSIGVTFFECVAGRRPTEAPSVGRVLRRIMLGDLEPIVLAAPSLPLGLQEMTTRMMAADRSARPTLDELRHAFRPFARRAPDTYVEAPPCHDSCEARREPPWVVDEAREALSRNDARDVRWAAIGRDDAGWHVEWRSRRDDVGRLVARVARHDIEPAEQLGRHRPRGAPPSRRACARATPAIRSGVGHALGNERALRDPETSRAWRHGYGLRGVRRAAPARCGAQGARRSGGAKRGEPSCASSP